MTAEILLINPPAIENTYNFVVPVGLASIARALETIGCHVDLWDLNIEGLTRGQTEQGIRALKKYPVIGIGGLITTYDYLTWFLPLLRRHSPQSKLIIGGGVSSQASELLLQKGLADFAVIGEGDVTIRELAASILEDRSCSSVAGIGYLQDGRPFYNPGRELIRDINDIPTPAYHLFDMPRYMGVASKHRKGRKTMSLVSSRGCPFNCSFCYHIFGRSYRRMSNERIIQELLKLKEAYRPDLFSFSDELFLADKDEVIDFCERYIAAGVAVPWWCKSRVDCVDPAMYRIMKKSGCEAIGYGFESASQSILDRMNKKTTVSQMAAAVEITREAGMYCGASFMCGYPGETRETIEATVRFCNKYALRLDGLYYATPYPGTRLYAEVEPIILNKFGSKESFIRRLGDTRTLVVNLTQFTDQELIELHDRALLAINNS